MRSAYQRNLQRTGAFIAEIGLFMAVLPFAGAAIGIQFDGAPTWTMTTDRLFLHVLPGVLGMALGGLLVYAARHESRTGRLSAIEPAHLRSLRRLAAAAIVVGLWQASGPWLGDLITGNSQSLMFEGVPNFNNFSPAHQLVLESVCHWLPGFFTLIAGLTCERLLRGQAQPVAAMVEPGVRV